MGFWSRLLGRAEAERGSTQDWVDAIAAAQESGFVQTTMPTLTEEQVSGTYSNFAKGNGPVWALILARMQLFSQARFQWARFVAGERTDLFGSPELAILERPWPGGTTADLLARMEVDISTAGNAYVRRLSRGRLKGTPDRLVRLRPDWVTVIMGSQEDAENPREAADVELIGYAYIPRGDVSRMVLLEPDEVAHYAPYPDPDAVFTGMSWVTPVIRDVLGDQLQTDHKRAFLRNAATPNLVMKFDPSISTEQIRAFKEVFEADHKGAWNAYKTAYIGGGADPIAVGKDFREIDFSQVQGKGESRLAAAAGVPPSWVGFSEGLQGSSLNAGNFSAARRRLSDGTLQHLWQNVATSLGALVTAPAGAELWFATRGIPFLHMDAIDEAEVQSKEAFTIVALVRDGFTHESAVDAVNNHDWTRLQPVLDKNGNTMLSVQLLPPVISGELSTGAVPAAPTAPGGA